MLVRWTKFSRRRCQFEVQERDSREEEEDESDGRPGGVIAVDEMLVWWTKFAKRTRKRSRRRWPRHVSAAAKV